MAGSTSQNRALATRKNDKSGPQIGPSTRIPWYPPITGQRERPPSGVTPVLFHGVGSYLHEQKLRCEPPEIVGVAGDDGLPGPLRTHDDVRIDDVRRPSACQQQADCRRIHSVERHQVSAGLTNQPAEADLPGRIPNGLCQRRGGNGNPQVARATSASTRRSLRSTAIKPPASSVMPLTPLSLAVELASVLWASASWERESRRPTRVPWALTAPPFAEANLPATPASPPRRKAPPRWRVARKPRRWRRHRRQRGRAPHRSVALEG